MSFNEKYKQIRQIVNDEITIIEEKMRLSIDVREPLKSYIIDFFNAPSKRIRPLIAILYYKSLGYKLTNMQLELLTAVELVHNASLIHDDIIDESEMRRGQKSIFSQFGNKLGVVAGDYILSVAMEKIAELNNPQILYLFSKTLKQMCIGEINQNFDKFKIITMDAYIEKSKNKTAYLFETALLSCGLLSDKSFNYQEVSDFGLNLGIAFQIRDDLLNFVADESLKPINNDMTDGIYTAPIIFANSVEDYSSGIEKTRVLLNNYKQEAAKMVDNLSENKYSFALREFLELLSNV